MNPAPHWRRDDRVTVDIQRALVAVAVPNPLVGAWRWRYEVVLLAGLSASLAAAIISFGAVPTILTALVITLTILCWPTARQSTVDRAWCIVTPHRVRVGCAEGLVYSRRGKIPIILWTSHQTFGERILLWCRAGISVEDFVSARALLTAACWAEDIAIFSDRRNKHLVTLDVIRRPSGEAASEVQVRHSANSPTRPTSWPGDQEL